MGLKTRLLRAVAGRHRGIPVAVAARVPGAKQYYAWRHGGKRVTRAAPYTGGFRGRVYQQTELHKVLGVKSASKFYRNVNARNRRDLGMMIKRFMGSARHRGQAAEMHGRFERIATNKASLRDVASVLMNPRVAGRAFIAAGSDVTRKGWVTRHRKYGKSGRRRKG